MRVSAYIAGNRKIVDSSLIVFESLKKYEDNIDCFLFLDNTNLESKKIEIINKLDIKLIKFEEDEVFKDSLTWPKECFLNFKAPEILNNLGYDIAIKLDYDILINGKLDVEKNVDIDKIFSLINHNYEKMKDMVLGNYEYFEKTFGISNWNEQALMFGNVYINIKKYCEYNFWEKYKSSYIDITKNSSNRNSNIIFADMGLFCVLLKKYEISYKKIQEIYNTCASTRHLKSYQDLELHPRVIHYAGPKKAWAKLGMKFIVNPYYTYLRQKWIDFILYESKLELYSEHKNNKNKILSKIINSKIYLAYIKLYVYIKKM